MFSTFRYNQTTKDHEDISRSGHLISVSADDREYIRTACDLCRARKLKCSGDKEGCDRCLSTSSACTYTFSSGIDAGKKRLRKVPAASFKSARLHQRPKPSESSSRFAGSTANAMQDDEQLRRREKRHAERQTPPSPPVGNMDHRVPGGSGSSNGTGSGPGSASEPASTSASGVSTMRAFQSTRFPVSPEPWPSISMDMTSLLNVPSDEDDFLTGKGFALCPGKHTGTHHAAPSGITPPTTARDTPHAEDGEPLSVDGGFYELFDLRQSGDDCNFPSQPTRPPTSSDSLMDDPFSHSEPSTAPPTQPPSRSDPSSAVFSGSISGHCGCLFSMLQTLEDLGAQSAVTTSTTSTDSLFLCLEQGIDRFGMMLSCSSCNTSASSPILVVTIASRLVDVVTELGNRFIQCQSPNTVPTVFKFGRYSVSHPALRTRLLQSMIDLHARDVHRLITRLASRMPGKQVSNLDDAKNRAEKVQRMLQDFGSVDT